MAYQQILWKYRGYGGNRHLNKRNKSMAPFMLGATRAFPVATSMY